MGSLQRGIYKQAGVMAAWKTFWRAGYCQDDREGCLTRVVTAEAGIDF